jgi:large subunit ribosomal protein L24
MKIKVNDQVKILAGKDKGKTGTVIKTLKKQDKVVVDGINICKKHQKPNNANENGGIIEFSAPIHVSNVKKIEEKETKKATKKETTKKDKK